MPYVTLPLNANGAVIELQVGVNEARRRNLEKHGHPVPRRNRVQVQIDTGTDFTAIDASERVKNSTFVQ